MSQKELNNDLHVTKQGITDARDSKLLLKYFHMLTLTINFILLYHIILSVSSNSSLYKML